MILEVSLIIKLDPEANFIGSDKDGAVLGLEEVLTDTLYDIDDITVLEIEVKQT